jgi:two-component system chemotaxis response regulator CheY
MVLGDFRHLHTGSVLNERGLAAVRRRSALTASCNVSLGARKMSSKVLVADDSSTMRKIILRSLAAVGVPDAVEAADGDEAIAAFKQDQFDLVLTDWNMPNKNGLELVREIRKLNKEVPVIMVTTEAEKSRVLEAIQAGVSDYLVKPFTADTLREKLEKHGC